MMRFLPLFLIYFGLAFYGIGLQDMEVVELLTTESLQRSWSELLFNRLKMGHPPLYFLMAKAWMIPFGSGQWALYALPAVIGAAGIPLMDSLARRMGMGKWSLGAALFWSVHPAVIYYARYLRPQMIVLVICTSSLLVLLQLLERADWKRYAVFVLLGVLGALTSHLMLFFWIGILGASLMINEVRRIANSWYWLALSGVLAVQIASSVLVKQFSGTLQDRLEWIKLPSVQKIGMIFFETINGFSLRLNEPSIMWFVPLATIGCLIYVAIIHRARYQWSLLLLSTGLSLGLFLFLTYTVQPLWVPRYLLIALPACILAVGEALRQIPSNKWRAAGAAVCLSISVATVFQMIEKRNFGLRAMVATLEQQIDSVNDAVVVLNIMTEEAVKRYSSLKIDPLLLRRRFPETKSMRLVNNHTKGKRRLWVLEYPKKESILQKTSWKEMEKNKFYEEQGKKIALHGYQLIGLHPREEQHVAD
jgi:mannosyltransferase